MITGETKLGFVHHDTARSHGFDYLPLRSDARAPGFEIGFVTADVEADFARAVQAGATSVAKPNQKPWGQVVSYVRDCNGLLVEICSAMG